MKKIISFEPLEEIEVALIQPVFGVLTDLAEIYPKRISQTLGQLYTSYRSSDKTIRIGFTSELTFREEETNHGFKLIEKRLGSLREEKLLKATLEELGYIPKSGKNNYHFSKNLVRHLKTLGWPTGDLNNEWKKQ